MIFGQKYIEKIKKPEKPTFFNTESSIFIILYLSILGYNVYSKDLLCSVIMLFITTLYTISRISIYSMKLKFFRESNVLWESQNVLNKNSFEIYDKDCFLIKFSVPSDELLIKLKYINTKREMENLNIKI